MQTQQVAEMTKFNVTQKRRRSVLAQQKRLLHGDPVSGKLHLKSQPIPISGKRKRKLLKKWRREQKEAVESGLITMQDVEMAVTDGTATNVIKTPVTFSMKKSSKLKVKQLKKNKKKGKHYSKSQKPVGEVSVDSMVE